MKFKIKKEPLLAAVSKIAGAAEHKQTMPILMHCCIEAKDGTIKMVSTDMEIQIAASTAALSMDEPGRVTLPVRRLMDLLRTLQPETEVGFSSSKKESTTVSYGTGRARLSGFDPDDFPSVGGESADVFSVSSLALKTVLSTVKYAIAKDDVRYYLNGALLECVEGALNAVATDGHRLAFSKVEAKDVRTQKELILPRKGVNELCRLLPEGDEVVDVGFGTNHIFVKGEGFEYVSKLIDGKYPDYRAVMPKKSGPRLIVDREALADAVGRVNLIQESDGAVLLELASGEIVIKARTGTDESVESVSVDYTGESAKIGASAHYLLDALNGSDTEKVVVYFAPAPNGAASVVYLYGEGDERNQHVVMPINL
ncbi:MAG: DNA polymerase III subunit beta [Acidiferrobacterales bacterium]